MSRCGAFSALAEIILKDDGAVYAASWADHEGRVAHARCGSSENLHSFRGVKYVQSDFSTCFQAVENDLAKHQKVLVTGTPCQIDALKRYLAVRKIQCDDLYTVDIVCHGIPSPGFFESYWQWLEQKHGSAIAEYRFRDKNISWRGHSCSVVFENGKRVENSRELCSYLNVYYSGNITRDCCYSCKYASLDRVGDITISDYWGIENVAPDFEDKLGVSMLLINTEQGKRLFESIPGGYISGDLAAAKQPQLCRPCDRPSTRELFRRECRSHEIEFLLRKYGGASGGKDTLKQMLHAVRRKLVMK